MNNQNIESMNVTTCWQCGQVIDLDNDDYEVINGEHVCRDCVDKYYTVCDVCGELVLAEDTYFVEDTCECVCDNCLDDGSVYTRCERCGNIVQTDNLTDVTVNRYGDIESWCISCIEDDARTCDECGELFHYDLMEEINDYFYCPECAEGVRERQEQECDNIEDWIAPYGVRSYSWKPSPCFIPKCSPLLWYIGFELEMEYHGRESRRDVDADADMLNKLLGFTYTKHDGSLRDPAFELVSHPATFEWLMENKQKISEAFDEMRKLGYTSHDNGRCGLHFHISLAPLLAQNEAAVNNLLILVDNHWDALVKFSRRKEEQLNRWAKRYCIPKMAKEDRNLWKNVKDRTSRYFAVNLDNTHTVELRMMRGTLRPETFFATLQLVKRLVDISIATSQKDIDQVTWAEIVDCDYEELRTYAAARVASIPTAEVYDSKPVLDTDEMHRRNLRYRFAFNYGDSTTYTVVSLLPDRENCVCVRDGQRSVLPCADLTPNGAAHRNEFRIGDFVIYDGYYYAVKHINTIGEEPCDTLLTAERMVYDSARNEYAGCSVDSVLVADHCTLV